MAEQERKTYENLLRRKKSKDFMGNTKKKVIENQPFWMKYEISFGHPKL